jgi:hypothetical protein
LSLVCRKRGAKSAARAHLSASGMLGIGETEIPEAFGKRRGHDISFISRRRQRCQPASGWGPPRGLPPPRRAACWGPSAPQTTAPASSAPPTRPTRQLRSQFRRRNSGRNPTACRVLLLLRSHRLSHSGSWRRSAKEEISRIRRRLRTGS